MWLVYTYLHISTDLNMNRFWIDFHPFAPMRWKHFDGLLEKIDVKFISFEFIYAYKCSTYTYLREYL